MELEKIFKALSSKTRLEILKFLAGGEKSVSAIVSRFRLTQPTISHHLKVLLQVGLVISRRYRQSVLYSLNRELLKCIAKEIVFDE